MEAADSQAGLTNVNISDEQHSSGEEEEMVEITIEEDMEVESEEVSARRRSTDLRDYFRDSMQKLEMSYAATRAGAFTNLRNLDEKSFREKMERAIHSYEEVRKMMAPAAPVASGKENHVQLARRPDVPLVGRTQALTPIRKLHKRSHLRKSVQAKRKRTTGIPDCDVDERHACAVCLRMQPNVASNDSRVSWIQCSTCNDWMHTDCISNTCPRDGTTLEVVEM